MNIDVITVGSAIASNPVLGLIIVLCMVAIIVWGAAAWAFGIPTSPISA